MAHSKVWEAPPGMLTSKDLSWLILFCHSLPLTPRNLTQSAYAALRGHLIKDVLFYLLRYSAVYAGRGLHVGRQEVGVNRPLNLR